mgnify:CR=1 FL=1
MKPVLCILNLFDVLRYSCNFNTHINESISFQRLEEIMSNILDLLRGPAFGVIVVTILIALTILISAFAALIAQCGLLLRFGSRERSLQNRNCQSPNGPSTGRTPPNERFESPQVVVIESKPEEVIEATWWQEVR